MLKSGVSLYSALSGGGVGDNSLLWTHWTREQICVQGLGISASGDYQTMWSAINKSEREREKKLKNQ